MGDIHGSLAVLAAFYGQVLSLIYGVLRMGGLLTAWLQELTTLNMLHFGITKTLSFNWMLDQIVLCSHSNKYYFMLKKRKKM